MNCNDVVRQVQRLFGDIYEAQITVPDIVDWINDAITTLARETEFYELIQTTAYGTATDGVTLPTQFIGEKRVTWNDCPLNKTTILELDDIGSLPSDTGPAVSHFYFFTGKTYLHPKPSETKDLVLYYVASPASVGADMNAQLPLPGHFHQTIVRRCMIRARELNEDWDQVQKLQQEVDANLGKTRDDQQNRGRETYPVVKDDPADWMH
jgi:hypothetical protein